jgi:hypothetical protein
MAAVVMPDTKKTAAPSSAIVNAPAFHAEVKGRRAVEERTTRIGRRCSGGSEGITRQWTWLSRVFG